MSRGRSGVLCSPPPWPQANALFSNIFLRWKQMRREWGALLMLCMNSMKLVILLHSLYWSIHTKDESKRGTAFAFIFGVNWLWRCGVTATFGVFFHEIKCNGMTSFMEFMFWAWFVAGTCTIPIVGVKTIQLVNFLRCIANSTDTLQNFWSTLHFIFPKKKQKDSQLFFT